MTWLCEEGLERRPIIVVEDHLNHLSDICRRLRAEQPELLRLVTLVGLDQRGPDTRRDVRRWLRDYPAIQVAAHLTVEDGRQLAERHPGRLLPIRSELLESAAPTELAELIAGLLRPGGFLLQDVQLETLRFIPADRLWLSIRILTTRVRDSVPGRPPVCWFMSNKKNPFQGVRQSLKDLGFEPDQFLDKDDLEGEVTSTFQDFLEEAMPFSLRVTKHGELIGDTVVGEEDLPDVMNGVDLALWQTNDTLLRLGGRSVKGEVLERQFDSIDGRAWRELVVDRFGQRAGVPTRRFGELRSRETPDDVDYDEMQISARGTRLAHRMRTVLRGDPKSVLETRDGTYRLADHLRVGRVTRSALFA